MKLLQINNIRDNLLAMSVPSPFHLLGLPRSDKCQSMEIVDFFGKVHLSPSTNNGEEDVV